MTASATSQSDFSSSARSQRYMDLSGDLISGKLVNLSQLRVQGAVLRNITYLTGETIHNQDQTKKTEPIIRGWMLDSTIPVKADGSESLTLFDYLQAYNIRNIPEVAQDVIMRQGGLQGDKRLFIIGENLPERNAVSFAPASRLSYIENPKLSDIRQMAMDETLQNSVFAIGSLALPTRIITHSLTPMISRGAKTGMTSVHQNGRIYMGDAADLITEQPGALYGLVNAGDPVNNHLLRRGPHVFPATSYKEPHDKIARGTQVLFQYEN